MKGYKEIHIWDFPPTLTFVRLSKKFRLNLFNTLISTVGSQNILLKKIRNLSAKYYSTKRYSRFNFYSWIKGEKLDRGKIKKINIPLWMLIELSKIISSSKKKNNPIMRKIEENIEYYTGWGNSNPIINPKLPLYLTPEMISIIFNFLGDGHIGSKGVCSSYRQMNREGLNNFLLKLKNIFGEFVYSDKEFDDGRLNIPKIITEFYNYYFNLPNTDTFEAYIPLNIKSLDKKFLIAGLASFIVDEGNVGETITVYSKNKRLIEDIREVAIKCGYVCLLVRKKNAKGKFDSYRFSISSKSYLRLYKDILNLKKEFPLCSLSHKTNNLEILIKKKSKGLTKEKNGVTRTLIFNLLKEKSRTTSELAGILNIVCSSVREHLYRLEKENEITKNGNKGRNLLWSIK